LNDGLAIGVGIAALGWALPRLPEAVGSDATSESVPLRKRVAEALSAWRDPAALLIGVGALANGFAEGGANDWMAIAAVEGHGLTQAGAALLYGAFVGGMTILRFVGGFIVDRWGRVWAIRVSAASAVLGIGLFVWTTGPLLAVVGCVLWGAGVSLGFPLAFSAAGDHPNGPARMSMVSTVGYGAFLMGPPLIGFLGQKIGIMAALSLLLVLLVIAAFVAPAARERAKERVIAS
ncbi:MAG: MFS transporter, partial [Agromyces sp.]